MASNRTRRPGTVWHRTRLAGAVSSGPRRLAAIAAVAAVLAAGCADPVIREVTAPATVTPTTAPTPTSAPTVENQPTPTPLPFAGEPGITAEELRIGVIHDVGVNPVSDQLSLSALEAVQAWAKSVNSQGGLVNRQVVVEPIETRPLLADHADAVDRACNSDLFALVGSSALFDGFGVDELESLPCRLPDFPATISSKDRLESEVTTVSNPIKSDVFQAGWAAFYASRTPNRAAHAATVLLDFEVSVIDGERMIEAAETQGMELLAQPKMPFETDFADEVAELVDAGAELLLWRSDGGRLLGFLEAYRSAGERRPTVDCAQACYSDVWVDAAGRLAQGVSVWLPHRPIDDAADSPELNRYLFWLGNAHGQGAEPTSTGIMAWASALLFEEAVNRATAAGTANYDPNNLTREGILEAASTIHEWDARGLHGVADPAGRRPSPCYVRLTFNDGAWERTNPARAGQLDCAEENLVELTITTALGAPTPTPSVPPDEDDDAEGSAEAPAPATPEN